jgi:hypothetical protein
MNGCHFFQLLSNWSGEMYGFKHMPRKILDYLGNVAQNIGG